MSGDKNSIDHRGRVLVNAEWVEGGSGIGVEQRGAQRIGVHDPTQALSAIIFVIAEPGFPVPSLKVIAELTQITFQADGKLVIVGRNLVGKQPQLLAQNFAVERAVEVFTVHWSHCRCESGEVKELFAPRKTKLRHILRIAFYIWKGVRRRSPRAAIKLWLVNKISDAPGKIARAIT